jgi:hypothetical protein
MIRASAAISSTRTRSSTACARSIPPVPTMHVGIPRAQKSRMSRPRARRRVPPTGARPAPPAARCSARGERPPVQAISTGGSSASAARSAASSPARAAPDPPPRARRRGARTRAGRAPSSTTRPRPTRGRAARARASPGARRRDLVERQPEAAEAAAGSRGRSDAGERRAFRRRVRSRRQARFAERHSVRPVGGTQRRSPPPGPRPRAVPSLNAAVDVGAGAASHARRRPPPR